MTHAHNASEPTLSDEATKTSAQGADTSSPAANRRCGVCGAHPYPRYAFFRNGPWDGRVVAFDNDPPMWRVPAMQLWRDVFEEEMSVSDLGVIYQTAIYERTEITFRGARVYIYRGIEK
jgi:hypothetical protein